MAKPQWSESPPVNKMILVVLAIILAAGPFDAAVAAKYEELAQAPPMGWNSWNTFACDIDEKLIRDTADAMVESGMRDAGYVYLNLDDCWHGERDELGFIQPDPERFPSGMKALADYVHGKGLKFGIYSDAGDMTCAKRAGSNGHEYQDALQYAKWGVDYLKYDWCYTDNLSPQGAYRTMRDALRKAGRPIVLSICEWGTNDPWLWGPEMGHLWRTTGDIINCFDCEVDHGTWSSWGILRILDMQEGLRRYAGPGHWNDPDMMEVGNGMSGDEDRAHFSLWAMLAAPLIAGNDLREMSEETREILTNKDVIAINQDPLGVQAFKYRDEGDLEYFFKPLADKSWGFLILNRGDEPAVIRFAWRKEDVVDPDFPAEGKGYDAKLRDSRYGYRELWTGEEGETGQALETTVPAHGVRVYRLDKVALSHID